MDGSEINNAMVRVELSESVAWTCRPETSTVSYATISIHTKSLVHDTGSRTFRVRFIHAILYHGMAS